VQARVQRAAIASGRAPASVTLVVVSKTVPAGVVRDALTAGATDLGENRAQELVAKAAELGGARLAPRWHFIGRLQRNKVRMLAGVVDLWHSIDRPELAEPLARHAPGARVLVEVNLSDEPQKGGCHPDAAAALVERLAASGLVVEGLMTVPAATGDPRPVFAALREMGARLGLAELSMGMTADFEAAIAEGATIVRVGSAIFGPRSGPEGLRR
jgi:pyridoxal phosphate enzyme (YggS family)